MHQRSKTDRVGVVFLVRSHYSVVAERYEFTAKY